MEMVDLNPFWIVDRRDKKHNVKIKRVFNNGEVWISGINGDDFMLIAKYDKIMSMKIKNPKHELQD